MRDNWKSFKIKNFGEIITGSTPSTKIKEYWDGDFPFYSPADFNDQVYCEDTERTITEKGLKTGRVLPVNSVLVTCIGSIGKIAISSKVGISNQQINAIVVCDTFDFEYIYYLLSQNKNRFIQSAPMTTIQIINKSEFGNFEFNLPPLPQQRKIAKILSTCDTVIAKTEEAIAKYQAIKQGMMHDLFTRGIDLSTGKLRPKYQDAPELYKESELGMIPKDWEVKRLEECVEIKVSNVDKKIHPNKKLVRLCNYMDSYNNDFITNDLDFMTGSADLNEISRFSLYPQDVIITKDSETPDDIAVPSVVIEELENVVCGYHLAILKPIHEVVNGEFLMYNLKVPSVQKYFFRIASGSTRYGLTIGGIQNAKFSIPKGEEQLEIKNKLRTLDSKIEAEKETLSKYHQIKSGLMQDLLSGKVEVSVSKEEELFKA